MGAKQDAAPPPFTANKLGLEVRMRTFVVTRLATTAVTANRGARALLVLANQLEWRSNVGRGAFPTR